MPERSLANAKWSASNDSIPQPTPKVNTKLSPSYKVDIFQLNAIKGKKIESPTSAQGGVAVRKLNSLISSGSHVLSIADLLDSVKDITLANEVFSKDVAKKLGVTRTTGTLSPDALFPLIG